MFYTFSTSVNTNMATSLLSAAEKEALNAVIDDIHETFAREITIYKEAGTVVIATNPSYNPYYNQNFGQNAGQIVNNPIYKTFKARIYYNDDTTKRYFNEAGLKSQIKLELVVGSIRLKINQEAYDFVKDGDSRRYDVDGKRYILNSTFRPHGLFDNQYYTLYLKPDA